MSSKAGFKILPISKTEARYILEKYHYLSAISADFKSGYNYGCFKDGQIVGVAIFTGFPVPELVEGMFGLDRFEQLGMFELSRLCLDPDIQKTEHNLASWFVSRCIRLLRRHTPVRAILSYADSAFHSGTIYAACNFGYYGLTDAKKDFYIKNADGTFKKHSRGPISGQLGEWRERTRKHRFVLLFDRTLQMRWKAEKWVHTSPNTDLATQLQAGVQTICRTPVEAFQMRLC